MGTTGHFVYEVTGATGFVTHRVNVEVQINPAAGGIADFSIHCDPISVTQGGHAHSQCIVTSLNHFSAESLDVRFMDWTSASNWGSYARYRALCLDSLT